MGMYDENGNRDESYSIYNRMCAGFEAKTFKLDTIARKVMYEELHAIHEWGNNGQPLADVRNAYPTAWGIGTAKGAMSDDAQEFAHLSFLENVRKAEERDQAIKDGHYHVRLEQAREIARRKRPYSLLLTSRL